METKRKLFDEIKIEDKYEKDEHHIYILLKPIRSCDNIVMNIVINNSEVEKCRNGN